MKGCRIKRKRRCRKCSAIYIGSQSYCSSRCYNAWKFVNSSRRGEITGELSNVVEEMCSIVVKLELAMPQDRKALKDRLAYLQERNERLTTEVNG